VKRQFLMGLALLIMVPGGTLPAATSPNKRPITDPKLIVSASNASGGAVPIEDLYYTRSVSGRPGRRVAAKSPSRRT
jgi:hypothetical protein